MGNEKIEKVKKLDIAENPDTTQGKCDPPCKCDGHCISSQPGTLGHHDNRNPLY